MLASIWSVLSWAIGILVALLVLLVIALWLVAIIWRTSPSTRQLRSNNPKTRDHAINQLREYWSLRCRDRYRINFDWRGRLKEEKLALDALSSVKAKSRMEAAVSLGDIGSAGSVPKLLLLLADDDETTALIAREAINAMRERLQIKGVDYLGICPRCESPQTNEGNYTGWRCKNCDLRYSPKGPRDPLHFTHFHGGPWDRRELVKLLDALNDLSGKDLLKEARRELLQAFTADAERIFAKRQQLLKQLGAENR
jgi:hypothetical protein